MTQLRLILARARNGVIGRAGALPWHLPEDLAHFRRTTMGAPVIMGRRTWDSIPGKFRPLPGRRNIVVTRNPDWLPLPASDRVVRADSIEHALRCCEGAEVAWVIGGAALFEAALPLASGAVVTEIDADFDGDVQAPSFGADWHETARESFTSTAAAGLRYAISTLRRDRDGSRCGDAGSDSFEGE